MDKDTYYTYFPYDTSTFVPLHEERGVSSAMGINKAQDNNANNNAKDAKVESGASKPSSAGWNRLKKAAVTDDSAKDNKPLIQTTPPEAKEEKPKSGGWSRLKGATTKGNETKAEEAKPLKDAVPAVPALPVSTPATSAINARARWNRSKELLGIKSNGNVRPTPTLNRTDSLVVPGQTKRPSISFSDGRDSLHSRSDGSAGSRRGSSRSLESRFSAIDISKLRAAQAAQEEEEEEDKNKSEHLYNFQLGLSTE